MKVPLKRLFGRVMRCWRGLLSGAGFKSFAYGPADAAATPSSPASVKYSMILPFWCRLTRGVMEKKPLNGCLTVKEQLLFCGTGRSVRNMVAYSSLWSQFVTLLMN